jgi:predicted nuclease of predicted toxin-antitoxin system
MGIGLRVAAWLREQGHEAVHLRELGLSRLPDPQIVEMAVSERRVIVTCDLDFPELLIRSGDATVSLIVFRIADERAPRVIERLSVVLDLTKAALERGAIVVIEDARHRVRPLPIGP